MTPGSPENWQIDHSCPQCGAPVTIGETDRLLLCPYCRTKLYLLTDDYFRYYIPTEESHPEASIYVPYWRLRGLSFSVLTHEVTNRFFDTNLLATDPISGLPHSLGLRPQALKLKFASPKMAGRFIEPKRMARTVIQTMSTNVASSYYHAFIGEMVSLIYCRMYLENDVLYDTLLKKPVCQISKEDADRWLKSGRSQDWQIRFMPTLCPQCGWDMPCEKDALVLICKNCASAWTCKGTGFEKVSFSVMASAEPDVCYYLPFWRIKARIEGIVLDSYADLIRLANLPKVVTGAFEETPLYFWSPAFKINPALFLRWSRQMTTYQPEGASLEVFPEVELYPVTLQVSEAEENIAITIAGMITDKRTLFPVLNQMRIATQEAVLVYHPFVISRNELIHATMRLSMDKTSLAFGARL